MTSRLANRLGLTMTPDPRRVIIKLFVPGEDAARVKSRAATLIERIAELSDEETGRLLEQTRQLFGDRHRDLFATFAHHYDLVRHRVDPSRELSETARLLLGAYFSHEYAVEAAALCNPSMVAHPDQSGLAAGRLRVAISLRQIGEGHISSIGFVTGIVGPDGLSLSERAGPLVTGARRSARHHRDVLAAGIVDDGLDNEVSATVLGSLPPQFTDDDFEQALRAMPADLLTRTTTIGTLERLRRMISAGYAVMFPADLGLDQRVLWPATASESNGMEDARFVTFVSDDGTLGYQATYTAYDGHRIGARMITSTDLVNFEISALRGPATSSKGMALFPRTVGGRRLALCRSDGETIGLSELSECNRWQHAAPLHTPQASWELIQVGNCGSPIETDQGWLVLTHGVGPMRRYAIGALLLDLDHPERVIGELPGPLLSPDESERNGYVPNVVYSCGGLRHGDTLWLPYGASDARIGFATVSIPDLLAAMRG
jgi:predicted GH43/DUF377 family glycosyl hydrolase